jgi:hypothetical protein
MREWFVFSDEISIKKIKAINDWHERLSQRYLNAATHTIKG